jgi:hypothetical protein
LPVQTDVTLARSPNGSNAANSTGGRVGRTFPAVRLLLYYAALALIAAVLITYVPGFRQALIAPIAEPPPGQVDELLTGGHPAVTGPATPWPGVFGRGALAFTLMLWALVTALPVAWAMKHTRQLRYDPSLVQALIVLPIVVSGVVLVVKNSLALAFALAGIVAGVRFRQKLDEAEQAVYVLLALGIGLAAGVQALDVALAMSMVFTVVVLTLWRYDLGDIFAGGRGALLAIGDPRLLEPSPSEARREVTHRDAAIADGMKPSGMLVVRAQDSEAARRGIETVLGRMATQWRIADPIVDRAGVPPRLEITVQMKEKCDPAELIAELEARLSDEITAAEYIPFGSPGKVD